jgi:tellurite resistance protein TehA-like permease
MVFPLGMYAAASVYLGRVDHLPLVEHVGGVALWVAVVVYTATLLAMAVHLVTRVVLGRGGATGSVPGAV